MKKFLKNYSYGIKLQTNFVSLIVRNISWKVLINTSKFNRSKSRPRFEKVQKWWNHDSGAHKLKQQTPRTDKL